VELATPIYKAGTELPSPPTDGAFHGNRNVPLEKWGLAGLSDDILREAAGIHEPVARITHVVSLGGRIAPDLGLAASPRSERLAWRSIAGWASQIGRPKRKLATLLVWHDRHGRVRLRYDGERLLPRLVRASIDGPIIAELDLDHRAESLLTAAIEEGERLDRLDAEVLAQWEASLTDEACQTMLATLSDAAQQSAPLLLFVGDELFSNLTDENLAGKALLPSAQQNVLRPRPLREFLADRPAVRMLALSAWLLYQAGGPHRLEERNWSQVTPTHIHEHLAATLRGYGVPTTKLHEAPEPAKLSSLAVAAREERGRLARECQSYRFIWGPTLRKQERFARRAAVVTAEQIFADALSATQLHTGSGRVYESERVDDYMSSVIAPTEGEPGSGALGLRLSAFEEAIAVAVAAVIRVTGADVAMSRGHRNPRELAAALGAGNWAELASREQDEFFCCVLPSARTAVSGVRPKLTLELWAIAARMEYNCWHFFGGNLAEVSEVRARDRFIPPKLPDIAIWADQHHRGHIATDVRFSVRAPAPASLAGRELWGFCDIRLMRFSGRPFTEEEMLVGLAGARHVARLTTALAALPIDTGPFELSHVSAFNRAWYLRGDVLDVAHELLS
jgi:hypothetical protein